MSGMDSGFFDLINPLNWANTIYGIYQGQKNYKLQKEQFEYQKELNQKLMDREDSAVQRRVADMQQAGYSKWSAMGSAASSTPVTSAPAPQDNTDITGMLNAFANIMNARTNAKAQRSQERVDNKTIDEKDQSIQESMSRVDLNASQKKAIDQKTKIEGSEQRFYNELDITRAEMEHLKDIEISIEALKEASLKTGSLTKLIAGVEGSRGLNVNGRVNAAALIVFAWNTKRLTEYTIKAFKENILNPIISGAKGLFKK